MKKSVSILLLAALICSLFAGCSIETKIQSGTEESKYSFYYLNASETVLKEEPYEPKEETTEFMVKDLMQKLGKKEVPESACFRKRCRSIHMMYRTIFWSLISAKSTVI